MTDRDDYPNGFKFDPSAFTTKDSGERQSYASGMQRDTERGKPRFDLLMPKGVPFADQMLTRFAALMARGAEKYDARNWEQADSAAELERYHSSAFRHFMQWIAGETDEDHAAAVMFNLMAAETLKYKLAFEASASRAANEIAASWDDEDDGPSCCEDDEDEWPEGWVDIGYTTDGGSFFMAPLGTPEPEPLATRRPEWPKYRAKSLGADPLNYRFDYETRSWRAFDGA
jgi:hypothetical protein